MLLNIFAALFEWWGLSPFYSADFGDHLRGFDLACSEYSGTPWYVNIGLIMLFIIFLGYAMFYHIINSSGFNKRIHWLIILCITALINFFIAFIIPFNDIRAGDYCDQLKINTYDCLGFGLSVAIWTSIIFTIISLLPYPRKFSSNCRATPINQ